MIACTRCGRRHTDAEENMGKNLSCTEVQEFWIQVRKEHEAAYGHPARISTDDDGNWICFDCRRRL